MIDQEEVAKRVAQLQWLVQMRLASGSKEVPDLSVEWQAADLLSRLSSALASAERERDEARALIDAMHERLPEVIAFLETEDVGDGAFSKWLDELRGPVIQEEYGYEPGEFEAFPSLWVHSFARGYSPSEAFKRACDAHREARALKE